jgi:hypothetical protein
MAVNAVFLEEIGAVRALRYVWSEDGALLLALDCQPSLGTEVLTFCQLLKHLNALCWWQLRDPVMIGHRYAVVEVVTLYHAFEFAQDHANSLMLVSTPPDEYFEARAA